MKGKNTYQTTNTFSHDEKLVTFNLRTGKLRDVNGGKHPNNIPEGKEIFEPDGIFRKDYTKSWEYLDKELTPLEFKVVAKLCRMAKMNTNSLEPLNDETTQQEISETFSIDHRRTKKVFSKLFMLGVYAKFETYKPDMPYTKYWILNPYLSFSGKIIQSDIARLFKGTFIEKAYSGTLGKTEIETVETKDKE